MSSKLGEMFVLFENKFVQVNVQSSLYMFCVASHNRSFISVIREDNQFSLLIY